jgi:aspartate aminotransferase
MMTESTFALAERVQRIKPSPTLAISNRAEELQAQGKPIINLSIGEPDFDTPEHIKEAAIRAIHDGRTKYTLVDGITELKQAIANKFAKENKLHYELNQILVSCGAKHSLYNLFNAILNPGDEVIIIAPYWVSYPDIVKLNDGTPVIINTDQSNHFKVSAEQLKSAITKKTRAIIINSPSNPSGIAYSKEELAQLGNVVRNYPDILVVTDDIYEHNLWDQASFANMINACPDLYQQSVVINGVSKSYAMTGFRIGYAAGPTKIIAAMKKAQSQITSNPTSVSQYAALAALTQDQSCIQTMCHAYKERHDFVLSQLQKIDGVTAIPSDGTFYTFPNVKDLFSEHNGIQTDLAFSEYLLNEAEIAVIPGSAFGTAGHIRLSYATSLANLQHAFERLEFAIKKLY